MQMPSRSPLFMPTSQPVTGHLTPRPPRILLRSGWQIENIGDVSHGPALLALLEANFPEAEVIFWPFYAYLPPEEVQILRHRFPRLQIVEGHLDDNGQASTPELARAIETSDFFLHNSGPATLGWKDALKFSRRTGRPFGVYGVTYGLYGTPEKAALSDAKFVYFRDSVSLHRAIGEGIKAPIMEWTPDAAFATDVRDDDKAMAYLKRVGLEADRFLCCIPKHRNTPAWLHVHKHRTIDTEKHRENEALWRHDHAPLLAAITAVVRETGLKVLIGHEDETELPIGKTWLWDELPSDVQKHVVWRDTLWQLDEALSIYVRSAGLFGHEMHSPIMCIGNGIPAIVGRWEQQSSKGIMWRDIGLGDWLFDMDVPAEVQAMPDAILQMAKNPMSARQKTEKARSLVKARSKETMYVVREAVLESWRRHAA